MATFDANAYDHVYVTGIPWNADDYDRTRRTLWLGLLDRLPPTSEAPVIPPNSIRMPCHDCGVGVAVGPAQQAQLPNIPNPIFLCMICSVRRRRRAASDGVQYYAAHLGDDPAQEPGVPEPVDPETVTEMLAEEAEQYLVLEQFRQGIPSAQAIPATQNLEGPGFVTQCWRCQKPGRLAHDPGPGMVPLCPECTRVWVDEHRRP